MKQTITANVIDSRYDSKNITTGKKYNVESKGIDHNFPGTYYYEIYNDVNILGKYAAKHFANFQNDNFENGPSKPTVCEAYVQPETIIYCVKCNQKIDLEKPQKCINDGLIHNCVSMLLSEYEKQTQLLSEYEKQTQSNVNHPTHYGGKDNPFEVIKIIRHYKLGFCLGNTLKYVIRAGRKNPEKYIEDLEKAKQYIDFKIEEVKQKQQTQ